MDDGSDMRTEIERSFEDAEAQGLEMFIVPRDDMIDVIFMEPLTDEQRFVLEPALGQAIWGAISLAKIREQRQNAARNPRKRHPHREKAIRIAQGYLSRRPHLGALWAATQAVSDDAWAGLDADEIPSIETIRKGLRK